MSETHKIQLLCELKRLEWNTQDAIVMWTKETWVKHTRCNCYVS